MNDGLNFGQKSEETFASLLLVGRVLANPVRVQNPETLEPASDLGEANNTSCKQNIFRSSPFLQQWTGDSSLASAG